MWLVPNDQGRWRLGITAPPLGGSLLFDAILFITVGGVLHCTCENDHQPVR